MNKKNTWKIVLAVALIIFFVAFFTALNEKMYSTYSFGDTGVSVTIYNKFKFQDDERKNTDVSIYNDELETYIVGRQLPDTFWASGDLLAACDEYLRTISAMYYDREIKDVSYEKIKVDGVEVGRVNMTASQKNSSNRATTLIFPKKYKNLIIEIYGNEEILNEKSYEIENVIKNIKIKK